MLLQQMNHVEMGILLQEGGIKPVSNKGIEVGNQLIALLSVILQRKPYSLTDTGYGETIKSVLIDNIHKFGNLYARYQNIF